MEARDHDTEIEGAKREILKTQGDNETVVAVRDRLAKEDATLEEQVLAPVTKHFNASALALGRAALGRVDPLFSKVMEGATSGIDEDG